MNVGLPPEPLPFVLAVAPSGTAIVSAATIPSTTPRPPRPQSAFARLPLRPHIALERVSPPRELDPHSAFDRVSLRGLFESLTVSCLSPFLPRIPARAAVPKAQASEGSEGVPHPNGSGPGRSLLRGSERPEGVDAPFRD